MANQANSAKSGGGNNASDHADPDAGNADQGHIFPPWIDTLVKLSGAGAAFGAMFVVSLIYFGFSPKALSAGYMPIQPVPYNHAIHAGEMGMDCRYCHTAVESAAHATIPPTSTCMNCHSTVGTEEDKLAPLRESYNTGNSVPWLKIHDLGDYAYFNHSAHVTRGVGCVECHGRIDQMEEVYQVKPLSMGWCLECHRDPAARLRPVGVESTDMAWGSDLSEEERRTIGLERMLHNGLIDEHGDPTTRMQVLQNCSTCHR